MEIFVNDLSFHSQFESPQTFRAALKTILECRDCANTYKRPYYVLRSIRDRSVTSGLSFRGAVQQLGDPNITRQVMSWIDRNGPFADDHLTRDPNEYYTYGEAVVTDNAIGEVAARLFAQQRAMLMSVYPSAYTFSPVPVEWHRSEAEREQTEVENYWRTETLRTALQAQQIAPMSWPDLIGQCTIRYPLLTLLPDVSGHLAGEPFSPAIADRVLVLLDVLNQLKGGFDEQGRRTAASEILLDNYFRRERAAFTDASETEKNDPTFRRVMTFAHPDGDGDDLECFWHGKISTRYYRIHFSYPIERDTPLYIAYIGPKLTKK